MGCLCGGGQTTSNQSGSFNNSGNSNFNGSSSNTTTPNIPSWALNRYGGTNGNLNANGANPDQAAGANYLVGNLTNNQYIPGSYSRANGATDAGMGAINAGAAAGGANMAAGAGYLTSNQNIGSNTLGHWFGDNTPSATYSGDISADQGSKYMGSYLDPYMNDVVNTSLADYDNGAASGLAALRGSLANGFGNKRTGVAEGQFAADSARGRGTLAAGLRSNAFNTAAGYGMTDANRFLTAAATNQSARNDISKFNANLLDSRQKFDVNEADIGDDRRLGIAKAIAGIGNDQTTAGINTGNALSNVGTQGLNNGINANNAGVNNANAVGNYGNMTTDQLLALLALGPSLYGNTSVGNSSGSSTNTSSGYSTGTGTSSQPGNLLGTLGGLAIGAGSMGLKL